MANRVINDWSLRVIVDQAFDTTRRPRNAWETMLDMIASQVRGGPQAQNRAIAYFLGVSERTVRRWRNERVIPPPRDRAYLFQKAYLTLIGRSPAGLGERVFFPVGFQFIVPDFLSNAVTPEDLADEYEAALDLYVQEVEPAPLVKPIPLAASQRLIGQFLSGGIAEVQMGGASETRIERALDPRRIWPTEVRENVQGRYADVKIRAVYGYVDFFNPYDLPLMTAKILALIKRATSGSLGSANSLSSLLTRLHAILRMEYGFYSPGNSKRPNARLDHTAPFMRWLERMIALAIVLDREIQEAQEEKRVNRNRTMTPEQRARKNAKERERRARKKGRGKR